MIAPSIDSLRLGSRFDSSYRACFARSEWNFRLGIAELLHDPRRNHRIRGTIVAMDSCPRPGFYTLSGLFGRWHCCLAHCRRAQYGLCRASLSLTRGDFARCLTWCSARCRFSTHRFGKICFLLRAVLLAFHHRIRNCCTSCSSQDSAYDSFASNLESRTGFRRCWSCWCRHCPGYTRGLGTRY